MDEAHNLPDRIRKGLERTLTKQIVMHGRFEVEEFMGYIQSKSEEKIWEWLLKSFKKLEKNMVTYFEKWNRGVEINKKEILESLDRATVVAEGYIPVTFVFENNDLLTITTLNKDVGGGKEEIGIKILGVEAGEIKGFKASFNPNFLIQGIEVLEGNTVYMRFSGNEKPVVIQGNVENYKYLLMPVRST